ncbi:MAG: ABC transporter permease, partial [Mucilaginibacter polytrichastri]|nr:ABC transporter permease [Mucilaginibacter polytrichastri]
MFRNYMIIAWRNLLRNKLFSLINIFGLALGFAVCILIVLFVLDETSYDKFNFKADRIYRVNTDIHLNGSSFTDRTTPAPMAAALMRDFPQIEQAVRISGGGNILVKKGRETLVEPNAFMADANLFDVFTLPMISGDPKTALAEPHTLVISESIARKYFNRTNVIGETLTVDNTTPLKIAGVIKDMPPQSHLHFHFLRTLLDDNDAVKSDFWLNNNYATYLLLRTKIDKQVVDGYLKQTATRYAEPQIQNLFHSSFSDLEGKGDYFRYGSIALKDIHLRSPLSTETEPAGNIQYVYIFLLTGLFILAIACVNFMNLSTARSAGRSKEVGIRKVLGSNRGRLIRQFLTESVLTSFIALLLAVVMVVLLLPLLNQIADKEINLLQLWSPVTLPVLILSIIFVGLLAGFYPAFYLARFRPVQVLKGKLAAGFKGSWLRNGLVVFQFSTAIILIIGTLVIYSQLSYIRNKDLGYNRDQVLVLKNAYSLSNHAQTFKEQILQIPG